MARRRRGTKSRASDDRIRLASSPTVLDPRALPIAVESPSSEEPREVAAEVSFLIEESTDICRQVPGLEGESPEDSPAIANEEAAPESEAPDCPGEVAHPSTTPSTYLRGYQDAVDDVRRRLREAAIRFDRLV